MLFGGIVVAQTTPDLELSLPVIAIIIALFQSLGSASAGIATEWLLKSSDDPIHVQNIQLYGWGMLMNLMGLMFIELPADGFFSGFNMWAWAACLNAAVNGLVVSAVVAYTNSIIKLYASIMAMFLSGVITYVFMEGAFTFTTNYFVGLSICAASIILYSRNPKQPQDILNPAFVSFIKETPLAPLLCICSEVEEPKKPEAAGQDDDGEETTPLTNNPANQEAEPQQYNRN